MRRLTGWAAWSALALLATGPARSAEPPPTGGTIAIEPQTAGDAYDPALHIYADAVGEALTARGFLVFDDPAHAAYWAELVLSRADVGTGLTKDPNGAKVGIGAGLIVPMSTGHSHEVALQRTRLELRIRKRDGDVVWQGTAVTVRAADAGQGSPQKVASDLLGALLQAYPEQPRDMLGVP